MIYPFIHTLNRNSTFFKHIHHKLKAIMEVIKQHKTDWVAVCRSRSQSIYILVFLYKRLQFFKGS